ncbi:MAG: 2-phospho-L-lactate transferase [Nitrososphaerota archaeon]|nr:2-phospho-L-lactate transferase [Nitrososphaerota archaeon]
MKVVALAGGTGSAKLLRGLQRLPVELTAVVNVGDDFWAYGVYVCPDIDIATYSLAGVADPAKGWGIAGDAFTVLERVRGLGAETWFRLGDLDLATSLVRTQMLHGGATLTQAADRVRRRLGVRSRVLPVTDSDVETRISTPKGELHLQEFWVREGGRPRVTGVSYVGARRAKVTPQAASAIMAADRIVLCPANPVTSLGPMLAVTGFPPLLSSSRARVVALSPMAGGAPYSGPAGKLLRAVGSRPDSVGIARLYSKFLDGMLISEHDSAMGPSIESLGIRCAATDTLMKGPRDELRLARELLEL